MPDQFSCLIFLISAYVINGLINHTGNHETTMLAGLDMQVSRNISTEQLKQQLTTFIGQQPAKIAVSFYIVNEHTYIGINDTTSMHAASTMKIPVMIEVYRQYEQGRFKLSDSLLVKNEFRSIVDQSVYSLNVDDDSADRLYSLLGQEESIYNLVVEMITSSGNLATNLLVELTGAQNIQSTMQQLGARHIRILRGVENGKAYRAGLNNTTTAQDLTLILQAIAEGKAGNIESTQSMIRILSDQKFNEKIPAGLPGGIKVAHKTGSIPDYVEHDTGIIFPPAKNPLILTILTQSFPTEKEANTCIAELAKMVYTWYINR
jgi:beta-lactamase class A